jgi:putative zinc finger/helix-turn-helix YgiT family protein
MMNCFDCDTGKLIETRENYRYLESGLPNVLLKDIQMRRCPDCGAQFVSIPAIEDLHRTIAMILVNKPGRLSPAEIKVMRKSLGWSGADFARKFHISPSQVSRWESVSSHQPMGKANELLLRTAVAFGQKIENYMDQAEKLELSKKSDPLSLTLAHTGGEWANAA